MPLSKQEYDQQPKYYAVPDPDTGDMTYWVRNRRGQIQSWPPKARYSPRYVIPDGLSREERDVDHRTWALTVLRPWFEQIEAAIEADPETALARFAAWSTRCCICGRALTDDDSKVMGIGPVCRDGWPESFLVAIADRIRQIHGERVKEAAPSPPAA